MAALIHRNLSCMCGVILLVTIVLSTLEVIETGQKVFFLGYGF